jgi:hypothetical protein
LNHFLKKLGILLPVIQAPMAGISTPAMAAAAKVEGAAKHFATLAHDPEVSAEKIRPSLRLPQGAIAAVLVADKNIDNLISYILSLRARGTERIFCLILRRVINLGLILKIHKTIKNCNFCPTRPERRIFGANSSGTRTAFQQWLAHNRV